MIAQLRRRFWNQRSQADDAALDLIAKSPLALQLVADASEAETAERRLLLDEVTNVREKAESDLAGLTAKLAAAEATVAETYAAHQRALGEMAELNMRRMSIEFACDRAVESRFKKLRASADPAIQKFITEVGRRWESLVKGGMDASKVRSVRDRAEQLAVTLAGDPSKEIANLRAELEQ